MLNAGKYRASPVSAALGLTSTNKEQIAVTFEFLEPAGERMTWYGYFTESTADRTLQSLRLCGWKGNDLSVFVENEPLPEGMDQEVELVVEQEEYPANSGKWHAKIAWVNSGSGVVLKNALSRDQAKAFADKMRRQIDALDKEAGRPGAATAGARPAPSAGSRPASAARPQGRPATRPAPSQSDQPPLEVLEEQSGGAPAGDDVPY